MSNFNAIGIMSGTSLDGIDIAYCSFDVNKPGAFEIIKAETFSYPSKWKSALQEAASCSGLKLAELTVSYSNYVAELVDRFRVANKLARPDILAFHGHTIFHQPENGFTFQLGSPAILATASGIATVGDFRSGNVNLGGQGAPLVPIGDANLFNNFDACLNLGGFGNISIINSAKIIAFDICPVNIALNGLAAKVGESYDDEGKLAAAGKVDQVTLDNLNSLPFYDQAPPKSLGREWYESVILPMLQNSEITTVDLLATYCEHIAIQISRAIPDQTVKRILVTGGGAHNSYLMERIKNRVEAEVVIPDYSLVDFKEALIFAYIGWLRFRHETNCLSGYTGSSRDLCSGSLHLA